MPAQRGIPHPDFPLRLAFLYLLSAAAAFASLALRAPLPVEAVGPLPQLSDYGLFEGPLAEQRPAPGVLPYSLRSPLFSDYAEKLRFVRLPEGEAAHYDGKEVFQFPVGTVLVKTFYYPCDARRPEGPRRLVETRLLIHEPAGWRALPYIWNEAQSDAFLEVAGEKLDVSFSAEDGSRRELRYSVPDLNQCKGCHSFNGKMAPIGPSARQLNGEHAYAGGSANQLQHWALNGLLKGLPARREDIPRAAVWNAPESGSLDERARVWLDINCAHCHRREGPASTSGLFLDIHSGSPEAMGINKAPVAAGRGSGGLRYGIVPGKPEKSILYYRMASTDPGVMMPELGRSVVHEEGLALIREWIREMKP